MDLPALHAAHERLQQNAVEPLVGVSRGTRTAVLCRVHNSLRVAPPIKAGITYHVWSIRELLA